MSAARKGSPTLKKLGFGTDAKTMFSLSSFHDAVATHRLADGVIRSNNYLKVFLLLAENPDVSDEARRELRTILAEKGERLNKLRQRAASAYRRPGCDEFIEAATAKAKAQREAEEEAASASSQGEGSEEGPRQSTNPFDNIDEDEGADAAYRGQRMQDQQQQQPPLHQYQQQMPQDNMHQMMRQMQQDNMQLMQQTMRQMQQDNMQLMQQMMQQMMQPQQQQMQPQYYPQQQQQQQQHYPQQQQHGQHNM